MLNHYNKVAVNNPNIPLVNPNCRQAAPYAQFVEAQIDSRYLLDESAGQVSARDMYLPDFSLREMQGTFNQDAVFYNYSEEGLDLIGSCLFLKVNMHSVLKDKEEGVASYARSQNFKYDPHNEFVHLVPAHTPVHLLHFSYTTDYFNQILPENEAWAEQLKERVLRKERIAGTRSVPLTPVQERILSNILNCPLEGKLRQLFIESSVVQLMIVHYYSLFNQPQNQKEKLNRKDLDLIHAVRDYLHHTFLHDHSLTSLAREFGVNTNKLMSLFKNTFSKSIFDFLNDLRMEYAYEVLNSEDCRVLDVARRLGYKNPNHFSTAFKRKYGFSPSELV